MSFLGELKRRNVFKVATAYAIVAWLIIQVATAVFPPLRFPEWSVPLVIVFLILGFPIALLAAWAYELTPEGIKHTRDVSPDESQVHVTGKKLNYAIIGLLALALSFVIVDAYVLDDSPPSADRSAELAAGGRSRADSASPAPRVSRVSINPSPGERWVISPHDPDFAISPDGTRIAYIARRGEANHVVLRS